MLLRCCGLLIFLFAVFGLYPVIAQAQDTKIGKKVPSFELKDDSGKSWESDDFRESRFVVAVFLGTECPLVKLYAGRLQEMHKEYEEQGVQFVGINSNQQDSLAEISAFVRRNKITFPMLKDPGNSVADGFGAERTPEVFVYNQERTVVYHGAIDDQYTYGLQKAKVANEYLKDALDELLVGKKPTHVESEFAGCFIGKKFSRKSKGNVTYANQISRILRDNCVSCHRAGEIGPFELTDYEEVVGWAEMIREVTAERRMPPWHADPKHGEFKNDARLAESDIALIDAWVDDGAPLGDVANLPKPRKFANGWQIGEPDLVIKMDEKPARVRARGVMPYRYFVVDPGFKKDRWIKAAEARAGNREVVHHIIVAAQTGRGNQKSIHGDLESEFITATAPGAPPLILPDGYAKRIPAGSKIVFQMHYTPNGQRTTDLSEVGFIFADPEKVKKEVLTVNAVNTKFKIPAGESDHPVRASRRFRKDSILLSLFPHMHLRGKAFRYTLRKPDGSKEILLDVPQYDFNWQNGYHLAKPLNIPKGSIMICEAVFDNSEKNLANPDPTKQVRWGDQTFEEMMIGYFDIVLADQDLRIK